MSDDRNRNPRRPGAGRRPPYVAGHRRRRDEDAPGYEAETFEPQDVPTDPGTPDVSADQPAAADQTPVADQTSSAEPTPDAPPTPDAQPSGSRPGPEAEPASTSPSSPADADPTPSAPSAPSADAAAADAGDAGGAADGAVEPASDGPVQQIRVASTGWPERRPADPLPKRTPGSTGGPGGVTAPITAAPTEDEPGDDVPSAGAAGVPADDVPSAGAADVPAGDVPSVSAADVPIAEVPAAPGSPLSGETTDALRPDESARSGEAPSDPSDPGEPGEPGEPAAASGERRGESGRPAQASAPTAPDVIAPATSVDTDLAGSPGLDGSPATAAVDHPTDADADESATSHPATQQGLTSPPLDGEPWAGLPPGDAAVLAAASTHPKGPDVLDVVPDSDDAPSASRRARRKDRKDRKAAAADAVDDATLVDESDAAGAAYPSSGDVVPPARRSIWARVREPLLTVAVLALAVLLGLNIWTHFFRTPTDHLTSSSAKEAVTAAQAVAVPILSYDYRTIDTQAAKVQPLVTARCASQYTNSLNSAVKPLVTQNQAVQQVKVLSTGVRTASADTVSVLVFAQLTSSNKTTTTQRINPIQLTLTMVHQHGRWLLDSTSANGSGSTTNASC